MNFSRTESPLSRHELTGKKMEAWMEAIKKGEKVDIDVYGKPSEKQLKDLENIRALSKELQDNLHEIENAVINVEKENNALNPTAPILDFSEDHEFVSANQLDDYYGSEDLADAREEERRKLTKGNAPNTEIQKFYADQCVFLTGATGFLGKVLIEKLLRSCKDVDTIYVLVRSKRGKDAQARINELFNDVLFERAFSENPKGIHKVVPIVGDMQAPRLGITDEDWKLLTNRVSIIINGAATVKFDEKLAIAVGINVTGTMSIIKLAKECRNLKAFTHISTAFSNTHFKHIEEKFYDVPMKVETLESLASLDDSIIEDILPKILGERPNTYSFTKAEAEEAIRVYAAGMPVCIVRPGIVVSTYEEPVRGWTDCVYGPTGLIVGAGTGVLRTMYMDIDRHADIVPVDMTVNAIISSAWYTAKNFRENQTSDIPIYNYVSSAQNPLTWGEFLKVNERNGLTIPTVRAVWYYGLNTTKNYYMFLFYNFFLHFLPALMIDSFHYLTGRKTKFLKLYSRLTKTAYVLFYYSLQDWNFSDANVQSMWRSLSAADQVVFPFSIGNLSWDYMAEKFLMGLRVYLIQDDLSTLPEARRKWNRLYLAHQLLKLAVIGLVLSLIYVLFKRLFW